MANIHIYRHPNGKKKPKTDRNPWGWIQITFTVPDDWPDEMYQHQFKIGNRTFVAFVEEKTPGFLSMKRMEHGSGKGKFRIAARVKMKSTGSTRSKIVHLMHLGVVEIGD